jgi:hypothetical protein
MRFALKTKNSRSLVEGGYFHLIRFLEMKREKLRTELNDVGLNTSADKS